MGFTKRYDTITGTGTGTVRYGYGYEVRYDRYDAIRIGVDREIGTKKSKRKEGRGTMRYGSLRARVTLQSYSTYDTGEI